MSLWLCLRFEQLPLQCLNRSEDHPIAVLLAQRVLRANDCAAVLGIREGMGTATVRALAGDEAVQLLERDEAAEARCLQQLCCWAYSITPTLHTWRQDCLQLEVEGCLTLFRGLDALLAEVASGLGSRGFHAHIGLAATPAAAWLLSFSGDSSEGSRGESGGGNDGENNRARSRESSGEGHETCHRENTNGDVATAIQQSLEQRLGPLPLALLTDFSATVDSLRRAGLHHLGDVLALPPRALGRRCGKDFTHFLQQVLGQREDLQEDYRPPTTFSNEYWFGYEVKTNEELMPAVQRLLQSLCRFLRNTQLRSGEITWRLIGIDQKLRDVHVCSGSSHSDWQNWFQLSRLRFEQLQLEGGVEGLALECDQLLPGQSESIDLFAPRNQREPLAALLDRLRNRLGLQAIEKVTCRDEHLPEYAVFAGSDIGPDHRCGNTNTAVPCAQRPFWLMPQPQPVKRSGARLYWSGPLELVYGPERIEDNWWREPVSRDYYIAENRNGQHYWVFCERMSSQWYIHGVFA